MKVSMVVINYNDKERVVRAINSCINQTYKDVEVIVVDDGSDEETRKIYKQFGNNIKLIQLERTDKTLRTPSRARNKGINMATGEYICFLDSDNYYEKTFVADMIKDEHDVSYCNWNIIGKQNYTAQIEKVWDMSKDILLEYLVKTNLDHQCLLISTKILDKVGLYDERLPRSQDCDMIVRLMKATKDWKHIPNFLFVFEKHEDDQNKVIASIHGKTLWFLKHGLNLEILLDRVKQSPLATFAVVKGINDFRTWSDFNDSPYREFYDVSNIIKEEQSERI
jgi:glycosyltransferase involved in cell wall biosynthesis